MLILPTLAVEVGGRAAWTVAVAAWIMAALGSVFAAAAARRYPDESFPRYLPRALGRVPGAVVAMLLVGVAVVAAGADLTLIFAAVDGVFLSRTPYLAGFIFIALVAAYQAWTGWRAIARLSPVMMAVLLGTALFLMMQLAPHADPGYLWPPLDRGQFRWEPLPLVAAVGGFHFPLWIPFLYPRSAAPRWFLRDFVAGSLVGALAVWVFTVAPVAILGPDAARMLQQAFPDITGIIALHRSFFDRPEHLARTVFNINAIVTVGTAVLGGAETLAGMTGAGNPRRFIVPVAGAGVGVAYLTYRLGLHRPLLFLAAAATYGFLLILGLIALRAPRRQQRQRQRPPRRG